MDEAPGGHRVVRRCGGRGGGVVQGARRGSDEGGEEERCRGQGGGAVHLPSHIIDL